MATAVKPLWLDGRSSAANVQVCGWGRPPISHYHTVSMVAALVRRCFITAPNSGSTRSNSSTGELCATRSNGGTDGSEAFAVGAYQRGTTGREAGLRSSAGRAPRGRVVPLHL